MKGNVTKTFNGDDGYIRLNFKRLDDRAPSYTSGPFGVTVSGNEITGYYPLAGYDTRKQDSFSTNNLTFPIVGANGKVTTGSNKDGITSRSSTVGAEFHDKLSDHFTVDDRFGYTWNNGIFSVPFYGSLTTAAALTTGLGAYTVTTANGATYTAVAGAVRQRTQCGAGRPRQYRDQRQPDAEHHDERHEPLGERFRPDGQVRSWQRPRHRAGGLLSLRPDHQHGLALERKPDRGYRR